MAMPEIETPRLRLRQFRMEDLDDFSSLVGDPAVMKYFGTGEVINREAAEVVLEKIINGWSRRGFGRWAVIHKGHQKLIGFCGFRLLDDVPELNYLLAVEYWGAGLATEACAACVRYGFEESNFDRIVAAVRVENAASQGVLKKVGMRYKEDKRYEGFDFLYFEARRKHYRQSR
jgi:[ribosomal protein S5]-alanine N-acetyltransferase